MKKLSVLMSVVALVAGCSTSNDVVMNANYQSATAASDIARMQAIAEIAKQGESGVVAAALLMQQQGGTTQRAPINSGDRVAGIIASVAPLVVGLGQIGATVYSADANRDVALAQSKNGLAAGINQSNNDATVMMHTNDTMANIAEATIVNPQIVCVVDATYMCD